MKERAKRFLFLQLLLVLYSLSGVFGKLASREQAMSLPFFGCYAAMLVLLSIYAFGWQQIIKRMPLSTAFANRSMTIIWGMIWGVAFFSEGVTVLNFIGALLVISGIILFSESEKRGISSDE